MSLRRGFFSLLVPGGRGLVPDEEADEIPGRPHNKVQNDGEEKVLHEMNRRVALATPEDRSFDFYVGLGLNVTDAFGGRRENVLNQ